MLEEGATYSQSSNELGTRDCGSLISRDRERKMVELTYSKGHISITLAYSEFTRMLSR